MRELQKAVHDNAVKHGFWENPINVGEKIALIHSELSELLEAFRKPERDDLNTGEELADTVIRVMDLAQYLGIDLQSEVEKKHTYNLTRPFKHGKRF